jgi:hypothetical protein
MTQDQNPFCELHLVVVQHVHNDGGMDNKEFRAARPKIWESATASLAGHAEEVFTSAELKKIPRIQKLDIFVGATSDDYGTTFSGRIDGVTTHCILSGFQLVGTVPASRFPSEGIQSGMSAIRCDRVDAGNNKVSLVSRRSDNESYDCIEVCLRGDQHFGIRIFISGEKAGGIEPLKQSLYPVASILGMIPESIGGKSAISQLGRIDETNVIELTRPFREYVFNGKSGNAASDECSV